MRISDWSSDVCSSDLFSDRFTTRSLRSADPGAPAAAPLRSLAASPAPAIGSGARGGEAVMPPRNRSTAGLFLALTRPQAPPAVGAIQTKQERRTGDTEMKSFVGHSAAPVRSGFRATYTLDRPRQCALRTAEGRGGKERGRTGRD